MRSRRLTMPIVPLPLVLVLGVATASAQAPGAARPAAFQLMETTIDEVHAAFRAGDLTCRELVEMYLRRIEAYDKAGPRLNAVQFLNPNALQEADRLDAALRASGPTGPLHCIPVVVKDQVETRDMPTTYGSMVFQDFVPQRDATIVSRLREAGAILVGKTTMGEFASRYVGSAFGIARNAYAPNRNPSGSSSGTGSAIAANFAVLGIGEDTGGSIRGPASVHALVGLRPTTPLVSRHGMMPATPTTDALGPIARTVRDAAILLDVIAGYDPNDPLTAYAYGRLPESYTTYLNADGLRGARIGVIREPMDRNTDPASEDYRKVRAVIDRAITDLRRLGAEVVDPAAIANLRDRMKQTYDDNQYETEEAVNAYLAQHLNAPVKTLREILLSGKINPWRATSLIRSVGKSGDDPGYLQVLLAREDLRQEVLTLMADQRLDALVYATFDHQTTEIGLDVLTNPSPKDSYGMGTNRLLSPVLGFPALTVPAGFTSDDLPIGLEFMARPFAEGTLFRLGSAYEQGTQHRRPPRTTPALPGEP